MVTHQIKENVVILQILADLTISDRIYNLKTYVESNQLLADGDNDFKGCICDLSQTEMLSSFGIGFLMGLFKDYRRNNKPFVISGLNDDILDILKQLNVDKMIKIFNSPNDALAYFRDNQ